ncbi:type II secretion system GspH family protein [Staphylococcus agnetis]|uniref:type II secretion system protein n=1 Tax=Staphylococcus agnetis TaxID=985762 RepID=UPI00208EEF1B|nr:type II secretion system protein [Staphylococcus agnetis]MCO4339165.1 type II secretion system GspH family protein [Staphylococcus agnetis]
MKLFCKSGFTLPIVFALFSIYLLVTSFYLVVFSLKLNALDALDALNDYYDKAIDTLVSERKSNIEHSK